MATNKGSRRAPAPGDDSHLDERYFVDAHVYNCPFCKRRHVMYYVESTERFDWSAKKKCYVYFVRCQSCSRISMHLSYTYIGLQPLGTMNGHARHRFLITKAEGDDATDVDLDAFFFHSVPSSFFALDERIPREIRELVAEADGCLKGNFLTGASACVRKAIYELAVRQNASGENYDERIRSLKEINKSMDAAFFDTLLTIKDITSAKVHEQSYDGWDARHIRVILATVMEILRELFVVPDERERRRAAILEMKQDLTGERPLAPKVEPETENGESLEQLASTSADEPPP